MKKNNWGCKKGGFPTGYEFEKCEKYWGKARKLISKQSEKVKKDFENAQKIKIDSKCENWTPECLNVKLFTDQGYCEVNGGNLDDWGICDTSCKHAKVLVTLFCHFIPIYLIMKSKSLIVCSINLFLQTIVYSRITTLTKETMLHLI